MPTKPQPHRGLTPDNPLASLLSDFTEAVTPEPRWMCEARVSFEWYVDHVFMELRSYRQSAFQRELCLEYQKWQKRRMGDPKRKTQETLLLWPRSFGKSTWTGCYYPTWRIGTDPNIRIIISSNTEAQAKIFLRQIESIMLNEPRFLELFGNMVPDARTLTWTDVEKIVLGRTDPLIKDATLYGLGVGGAIINRRADIIIADDIVDQENSSTKLQREKLKAWFWQSLRPVLEPGGQLIVSGTRYHEDDLYGDLIKLWAEENGNDSVFDGTAFTGLPCHAPELHT